jgi:hypothetical protein
MEDQTAQTELNRWLSDQIAEARLSAGEIKEFVQWLTQKHEGRTERQIMRKTNEVEEFIYWFKDRIRQSSINEAEKQQLKSWLFGKLTNSGLRSDETDRIREHLTRSVDS